MNYNEENPHKELMQVYQQQVEKDPQAYKLWQFKDDAGNWQFCTNHPLWCHNIEYRYLTVSE